MSNLKAGASIDAARELGGEYQVFLNFRGPDTRVAFTDFLYEGLKDEGVRVFRDDNELRVGEVIGENILRAIDNSIIYIPIFSSTYVSSKWCLRELVRMRHNLSVPKGQKVIFPIFLLVEPDDIKLKTELYIKDFERLQKETTEEEVEAWRDALAKVEAIKGWVVKKDQSQAKMVKLVVEKVLEELRIKQKSVPEHLVGYDDRVKYLTELLDVKQLDVRLIEICGMGGMGKTTIAKVVYNKLCSHFGRHCSFLEDVREKFTQEERIVQLQKKLLCDIGCSRSAENINDREEGMGRIGAAFRDKKVLVVLDDVDMSVPIDNLIGNFKLYEGSRIIITTRYIDIVPVGKFKVDIRHHYDMPKMDDALALQLFCRHAFDSDFPSDDYRDLSSEIVSLMDRLPLAIEVVGLSLKDKGEGRWMETLDRLRKEPEKAIEKRILENLIISYEHLEVDQQQIFLDIACFLFNEKKTDATHIWKQCRFSPDRGIEALIKGSLIKILDNDQLWMHSQLIDLGRHIVHKESPSNPGKRSRLWVAKEALKILKTNEVKYKVEAIKMDELNDSIEITNEEFKRLQNLRLLKLGNGSYSADFANYCPQLGWISCRSPNWDLTGDNMNSHNLVVFKLHDAGFTDNAKEWDSIKSARNLKVLSLTQCGGITTIPNFSNCLGLEKLTLAHCDRLKIIESSIGDLKSLKELEIECCKCLIDLPKEVGELVKLERFSLRGCSGLRELPCSFENLTSLIELDLSKTGIAKLPESMKGLLKLEPFLLIDPSMKEFRQFIDKLRSLRVLSLPKNGSYFPEDHVWQLPSDISMLKILEELDSSGHDGMTRKTPVGIGDLSSFRTLNLTSNQICDIPRNIDMLHYLQTLNLGNCDEIQGSSDRPSRTINMLHQQASSPPELPSLSRLDLKTPVQPPSSLLRLDLLCSSFKWANLLPPSLILRNLTTLEFYYVEVEEGIPLDRLPGLESLTVDGCEKLLRLTISSENLRQAYLSFCPDLVDISFTFSEQLESFFIFGCRSLETINWSDCMKNLEKLEIHQCDDLTDVWGRGHLESLKYLEVTECPSLTSLIDASSTNISDDCLVKIQKCGDIFKDSTSSDPTGMPLLRYVQEILLDTLNLESKSGKTEAGEEATAWRTSKESCTKEKGKEKDGAKFGISGSNEIPDTAFVGGSSRLGPDEDSNSGSVGESETDDTSPIDDFQSEMGIDECPDAMGNRRQTRDRTLLPERDRTPETGRVLAKRGRGRGTRCASEPGRNPAQRGRARGLASSLRNSKALRSRWDATSSGEGMASNSGRGIVSSSQSSTALSSGRGTNKMGEILRSGTDKGSSLAKALPQSSRVMTRTARQTQTSTEARGRSKEIEIGFVGESETDGTSPIHDFQSEPANTECFGVVGNRRQMRDRRIGRYDNIDGGKTASTEMGKKNKDEIGVPANPSDVVGSSCQTCEGVEHHERSGKATTEVEDQRDLSSVERDRTLETDRVHTKAGKVSGTRCASEPGRNPAQRGRARGLASSLRNGTALSSGRGIVSSSRSSMALNSGRGTNKMGEILKSGTDKGSSSAKALPQASRVMTRTARQTQTSTEARGRSKEIETAFVGESETDSTSRIHDFQSEPANTECFEAVGNMRQMRDRRIGRYDNVDGGKTASIEMGKKDKDEIGVPANPSGDVGSSCQTCEGVEHLERSGKTTTEVEDQRDLSSVERDRT